MNKGLKNKGLGSWFCLAAALVALITGIVFLLTQATAAPLGHSGTMAGVVLLVGAAASLVFFFVSVPFSALIQAVIYNIALYLVVVQLYFVFADVINHVTFAGGNAGLCVFYMVGTFIACLLSVIACFCKQTKTGEAKATGKQFAAAGAVVVVAAVCVGGFSLQSSSLPSADNAEVAPDAAQTSAEGPVMNYSDNEFTSKTLDDLVAIPQETWEAKEPNGEVAYFFEGQYTEGFSTIVDPACLDMCPSTFTYRFKLILKANNLPLDLSVHSLRHTNASLLISQGVDVRTVASLLGHAQASTTLDIYAHAFDKNKRKAQEKLGKAIGL